MKQLISSFLILFCLFIQAKAQDSIFKTNGDVVVGKIQEISSSEVRYKKVNFLDGPMYVELKTDIASIHYSNGVKEEFTQSIGSIA